MDKAQRAQAAIEKLKSKERIPADVRRIIQRFKRSKTNAINAGDLARLERVAR